MAWEDFLWGYLVPEWQELQFRIEDFLLHTYTGFFCCNSYSTEKNLQLV